MIISEDMGQTTLNENLFSEQDQPLESLTRLLAAYPDLKTTLSGALQFILQVTHRNGGLLIVQGPDDQQPLISIFINPPSDWAVQLSVESSMLRTLCKNWIQPSGLVVTEGPFSPVVLYPLTTAIGQQGILLLDGLESPFDEKAFLIKAAQSLGHSVYLGRNGSILFEISKLLDTLGMIIDGMNPKHTLDEAQIKLVSGLRDSFSCEIGSIALLDSSHNDVIIKKSLASSHEWIYQVSLRTGEGLLGECLQTGKSLISNNPEDDERFKKNIDAIPGFGTRALLCVPLEDEGKTIGILVLQNKNNGDFTLYDQQLLSTIAKTIVNSFISLQKIQKFHVLNAHLEASRWELVRSRNTLRTLFDNLPDSLYIIDRSYHLVAVNSTRAERAKGEPSLLVNRLCYETLFERDQPCEGCLVSGTFETGKVTFRPVRQWQEGFDPVDWEISTYPITDDAEEVIQAILVEKDVTEKKRLEGFLAQSEKMAAIGVLASGIAHEINNPLTAVLVNAEIMQKQIPAENVDWIDSLDLIYRGGTRALHSVRNLLNFARKEEFEITPTDINQTIQSVLEMLKHEVMSRSVELIFEPEDDLPLINASSNYLQGVWLNLIVNAMDAIGEKTDGVIRIATILHDKELRVVIADNGEGIPGDKLKRIFEPFYTTKDPNKGTGLGLSICHRVIKQHGGLILVDSQVGKGTTFTIVLPVEE